MAELARISADETTATLGVATLRKARWRLIPLLAVCYCVAYIDRVNVSFASLHMNHDLHFSAAVYGLGSGVFFLSYASCEIPANMLMLRFGARRWLARIMVTWGLLAICMMTVRTPFSFYSLRFLLGMAEAGFFPGVMYYLTLWFPRRMRARTVSYFYVALPLSATVMGSIAGYLLGLQGRMGLQGWQWLFLVEGIPAVLLGVTLWFVLPDGPADARWLSEEQRAWLTEHMAADRARVLGDGAGLRSALMDRRVWLLGLFNFCFLTVLYAYSFMAPLMIQQATRLNDTRIGWVVAGLGLLGAASMLLVGWLSERRAGLRGYLVGCTLMMAAGCMAVAVAHGGMALVGALALIVTGFYGMQGPFWALPGSFLSGPAAAGGLAFITMIGMIGGFLGPYGLGLTKDLTGDYRASMLALGALSLISIALVYPLAQRHDALTAAVRDAELLPTVQAMD